MIAASLSVRPRGVSPQRATLCAILLTVAAVALGGDEASAQGCAMCKTAIGGAGDPLARGINASIFFMMAMPFVLFAAVGSWLAYMFWSGGVAIDDGGAAAVESDVGAPSIEREAVR